MAFYRSRYKIKLLLLCKGRVRKWTLTADAETKSKLENRSVNLRQTALLPLLLPHFTGSQFSSQNQLLRPILFYIHYFQNLVLCFSTKLGYDK